MGFWALQPPVRYDLELPGLNTINPGFASCQVSGHFFSVICDTSMLIHSLVKFDFVVCPFHSRQVLVGYPAEPVIHRAFH